MAAYAASKWAAIGFSDSVRLELEQAGHHRVRVTTVCPTYINTGMFEGARDSLHPDAQTGGRRRPDLEGNAGGGPFVVIPWTSRLNKVLTGVLPVRLRDIYLRRAGVYNSMDQFTGH